MRKNLIFLAVIASLLFASCKNDTIEDLSFREIFESLPVTSSITETNMKVEIIEPGNGPSYQILSYNDSKLIETGKVNFTIIAKDLAFGEGPYGTLYLANKNNLIMVHSENLLLNNDNWIDFHSYQARVDKNCIYIKGELWQNDGEKILEEIYFRYELATNILTNKYGQKINFNN